MKVTTQIQMKIQSLSEALASPKQIEMKIQIQMKIQIHVKVKTQIQMKIQIQ